MKHKIQCRRCDDYINIPAFGDFSQDIFVTVVADPLMHQRVPICKDCWHHWNELQVKVAKKFLGPEKLDPLPPQKKKLPKLN